MCVSHNIILLKSRDSSLSTSQSCTQSRCLVNVCWTQFMKGGLLGKLIFVKSPQYRFFSPSKPLPLIFYLKSSVIALLVNWERAQNEQLPFLPTVDMGPPDNLKKQKIPFIGFGVVVVSGVTQKTSLSDLNFLTVSSPFANKDSLNLACPLALNLSRIHSIP